MNQNGRPRRQLLETEILAAQSISKSEGEAARKLGVSDATYKKYAVMFGIYGRVMNRAGKGVDKSIKNEDSGKYPLNRIFANEFPNYEPHRLRVRCVRSRKLEEKCYKCGFSEKRILDNRVPVLLNFVDGNDKNMALENLELLCYNCYFLYVNNPYGQRKKFDIGLEAKE
jgi:hypothetical protein